MNKEQLEADNYFNTCLMPKNALRPSLDQYLRFLRYDPAIMLKRNMSEKLKQETQQLNLSDPADIARLEQNAVKLLEYHYQWM